MSFGQSRHSSEHQTRQTDAQLRTNSLQPSVDRFNLAEASRNAVGQEHMQAYNSMLDVQNEIRETKMEARKRKLRTEAELLQTDQIRRIQIFNLKFSVTAKMVADTFNKFENTVTSVVLNKKMPTQLHIPNSCPHNGSGLVTFASSTTVKQLIIRAPLREIRGRQVRIMYTELGENNVLHVKLYEGQSTKDMKKYGGENILFTGSRFDLGNWAAPQKLVTLFSIVSSIEVRALNAFLVWQFEYQGNRYKFELAYKYIAGKAELHLPDSGAPFLLMDLRIPPKLERLPIQNANTLETSTSKSDSFRRVGDIIATGISASSLQDASWTGREQQAQSDALKWTQDPSESDWRRTVDFTAANDIGNSFVYRITLANEFRDKVKLLAIRNQLRDLGVIKRTDMRPIEDVPRELGNEANCTRSLETLSYDASPSCLHVVKLCQSICSAGVGRILEYLSESLVWFCLECLISNGILSMQQIKIGFTEMLKDTRIPEEVICQALSLLLAARVKLTRPVKQFRSMVRDIMYDGRQLHALGRQLPDYCMLVRRCLITPTRVVRLPPETELSNRILRKYKDHADRFLRVSFGEENAGIMHLGGRPSTIQDLIARLICFRIRNLLKGGITVAGRTFQFLAFSTSQLRDMSAWCFSPLPFLSADRIRHEMGDLTGIRCVAKYAARMGQCFSSTVATVELQESEFERIPDVKVGSYIFSDGCGLISRVLAEEVADVMKAQGRINSAIHTEPSAYQLRFGGCKGIVVVYPDADGGTPNLPHQLKGRKMLIRPSLEKFPSTGRHIEVVDFSRQHPAFLNRQIITILFEKSLGVKDEIFQVLQDNMLETLEGLATSARKARHVLRHYGSIGSDELVNNLLSMINAGFDVAQEPYLRGLLTTIRSHLLQELKNRTRIFVKDAALLIGTMDESHLLQEGEVFVQSNPGPLQDSPEIITGTVIVTKNPCFHPGDIRKLKAVDIPQLHHLHNLVVFSSKGLRPPANEISGSDCDGDRFFVCWDPSLIPPRNYLPMAYQSPEPKELNREVVIQDVADFFVDHAISDNLGIIANAHLAMADQAVDGVRNPKCLALAQLHSDAVDFPKTGEVVTIPDSLRPKVVPDFMQSKRKSYESKTIIGRLYRQIQVPDVELGEHSIGDCDEHLLFDQYFDFVHTAWNARVEYEQQLVQIMAQFSVADEFQLISGCIIEWDKLYKRRNGKRFDTKCHITEAVQTLQRKFLGIFEEELRQMFPEVHVRRQKALEKASAWYYVTYHPSFRSNPHSRQGMEGKHRLISFAWIPGMYLTELKQRYKTVRRQQQFESDKPEPL